MQSRRSFYQLLHVAALIMAGISSALGILVLGGWYTHNTMLVQVLPAFVPMQFNTALGFLFCGIGLAAQSFNQRPLAAALGALVALLGLFTIVQYLSGVDFSIDQLFMKHYVTVETSSPGRMAPNTALCFLLSGLALIIANKFIKSRQHMPIVGILASVIISLGGVALLGYLGEIETAYGWGKFTRMAVHTSAGFIALGTGIFLFSWRESVDKNRLIFPAWIALPAGVGMAAVSVTLWQTWMSQVGEGQPVSLHFITLGTGLLIALLIALTIRVAQTSAYRTIELGQLNQELNEEINERKLAEESLHESEERFRQVAESAEEWIWEIDNYGLYVYSSPVVEKILGYKPEDIVGKRYFYDFFHPSVRTKLKETAFQAFSSKLDIRDFENPNQHKDGHTVILKTSGHPVLDKEGNLLGYRGADSDITIRKQAEDELEKERQFLKAVLDNVASGIVACDSNGILTMFNRATQEFHGLPAETIPADQWAQYYDLYLSDGKTRMSKEEIPLFRALQGERVDNIEMMIMPKSGDARTVLASGQEIKDTDGKKLGAVVAMHDITERKHAEAALKKSEEKYRSFFEEDLTGDYISTPAGRLLFCNPAFIKIFGFESFDEAMSYNLSSLYPSVEARETFLTELKQKKKIKLKEVELRNCQGEAIVVIQNVIGRFDENDQLVEIQGYLLDISERKKLEEQLRGAQKMEAIGMLAGGVAHDFNNLLTVINGYSKLLINRLTDDNPMKKKLVQIGKAGERAKALTGQLLAFSRRQMLQPQILNINDL